ncbi:MAG TPA: ABC transporter permease [Blastocatellia bacterium]|nr:ABC transporter permease [Blastocatellia bacterium]
MKRLLQDLRFGIRVLMKSPGFTAVAVLTLALGIGANSAIFSVVNAVLLRSLPYENPEELVLINHDYPKLNLSASVSAFGYTHYRDNAQSFENVAALTGWAANLTGQGEPERVQGNVVTTNFFSTLGVEPAIGRVFLPEEGQAGRNRVVVLSDSFWRRRFAADPNVLNQTIALNGENCTIVGIMPPGFEFGRELGFNVDLWAPLVFPPELLTPDNLTNEFLSVVARLKPGVTVEQGQAELDLIADNLRNQYRPQSDRSDWGLTVQSFRERVVGDIRPALLVLLGAVGLVLLIACANVANLLLARGAARQKEIAIRTAMGASRFRIIRQLLTESLLLAVAGGGLGLALGLWGVKLLVSLNEARIPRAQEIGLDMNVLGFALLISLLTGIIFGLAPALQISRTDLHETLKEGGRGGTGGVRHRVRSGLVILETALALVLLVGAGLLVKSFIRLQQVDPGFRPENLLVMQLALPGTRYSEPQQIAAFYKQALDQISALPGVEAAGATSVLPLSGAGSSGSFRIQGREVAPGETLPHGARWSVTYDYFKAMGIPLKRGRYFSERDTADSPGVAIIDEAMARKYWPDEDPVGQRISFEGPPNNRRWREIVGIVGHVKHTSLEGESRVQYYIPHPQRPQAGMFLAVRTAGDPTSIAGAVRGVIQGLDRDLPVFRVRAMEELVYDAMARQRFSVFLLGIFGALALVLAAVGLYGVMAYSVTQRTHEIGIRMAMGAGRADVLKLIVGQGMLLTVTGLAIGIGAAFALTRLMSALLFGVSATDAAVFIIISLTLATVAFLACFIPARRATKIDPMVALRYE